MPGHDANLEGFDAGFPAYTKKRFHTLSSVSEEGPRHEVAPSDFLVLAAVAGLRTKRPEGRLVRLEFPDG